MTLLPDAKKDPQIITSSWDKLRELIDGVQIHEVRPVPGDRGVLTEILRVEWDPENPVGQVFQVRLFPGQLAAWHCHQGAVDRLSVISGHAKIVLYDGREGSPTHGAVNEFHMGQSRPGLLVIPPEVWHGVKCLGATDAVLINCPSDAYCYEDPDHWRLPEDSPHIPYTW